MTEQELAGMIWNIKKITIKLNCFFLRSRKQSLTSLFIPLTVVVLSLAGVTSCAKNKNYISEEGLIWNTSFHVTYKGPESLRDSVLKILEEVGSSLSVFDKNSLVSKINDTVALPVDNHFMRVYQISRRVCEQSNGMFDPTLSPLITAWGFGPGHKASADTARVDSILQFVGLRKTNLSSDGTLVKEDPRIQFNFSAVAKGYACDAVGDMLLHNGVEDWLVEIGGEVATHGKGPRGDWTISVDRPVFSPDKVVHESQCIIKLSGNAVATSGNYRNLMQTEGGYYGHTISPASGRPVQTDVISATVVAPTCAEADAYATACMAMGSRGAKRIADACPVSMMLVLADSTLWISPGFPMAR